MFGSGLGCLEEESIFASQGSVASQVGLSQTLQLAPAAADLDPEHKATADRAREAGHCQVPTAGRQASSPEAKASKDSLRVEAQADAWPGAGRKTCDPVMKKPAAAPIGPPGPHLLDAFFYSNVKLDDLLKVHQAIVLELKQSMDKTDAYGNALHADCCEWMAAQFPSSERLANWKEQL
ncbi:unnamed protein product, partial [Effrenium voratum]